MFVCPSALSISLVTLKAKLPWLAHGHAASFAGKLQDCYCNFRDQLPECQKVDFALESCHKQQDVTASPPW